MFCSLRLPSSLRDFPFTGRHELDGGDGWQYHRGGFNNGFGWCDFVNGFNFDDGFNDGIIGGGHLRIVGTALDPTTIVCCRRGMWIVVVGIRPTGIGTDGGSGIGSRHTRIVLIGDKPV